ncbi:hypothetical protein [Sphingomonas alpina]|nr:hypothetical protein [Sphingomonas alpina]
MLDDVSSRDGLAMKAAGSRFNMAIGHANIAPLEFLPERSSRSFSS